MTTLDFPNSPSPGDIFSSSSGRQWQWDGSVWNSISGFTGPTGPSGPPDPVVQAILFR